MGISAPISSFGPYELRLATRELYKHGVKIRLRPQPFRVLQILLEHAGEPVSREDLRRELWQSDTFVDFEHGLNTSVKELRAVLSDSADKPRYIETLPKLGYRFLTEVRRLPVDELAVRKTRDENQVPVPLAKPFWRISRGWAALLVITILMAVALASYYQWSRARDQPVAAAGRVMLAVLPFDNLTGDAGQEYFSDGLTEEMITDLGRLHPEHLGVIARTSVMFYKHSPKPLEQIGRELGVQYVIEGSVRRDSGNVRITAQLIQVEDQTHVWARQYDRELKNLLVLQGEIAQEVADEVQLSIGGRHTVEAANPVAAAPASTSYEAYDLYLRGRYFWNKRTPQGFEQAAEYFQQAIEKDPKYARAYAGLADTFGLMSVWLLVPQNEFMPKARAAALKALELDETLAEAHTSLALIAENYDYDWQTAENEFRRAIQLNPQYATAHQWYAEYLSWQGRFDEALQESERARQLDPMSLIIATDYAAILYYSRQYDRAITQSRAVLDMDSSFHARPYAFWSYAEQGRFAEALEEVRRQGDVEDLPWTWAERTYMYGRWGRKTQLQHALAEFKRLAPKLKSDRIAAELVVYLGAAQNDKVIALLQKACLEHSNTIVNLKVDPRFDPLRNDPRFQELLRRVALVQ